MRVRALTALIGLTVLIVGLFAGRAEALRVAELGQYMPVRESTVSEFEITAPIAGLISSIAVAKGDSIRAGQQLFVIEAMKMQNEVRSPKSGTVEGIAVSAGQTVNAGDTLGICD